MHEWAVKFLKKDKSGSWTVSISAKTSEAAVAMAETVLESVCDEDESWLDAAVVEARIVQ